MLTLFNKTKDRLMILCGYKGAKTVYEANKIARFCERFH